MRRHFDFYGYNSPTAGLYYVDDEVYTLGEDYRNVKRYKEYKNVGFNVLLLQHENSYRGEDFKSSACKLCMDKGYAAGIDKVIVSDTRLKDLCEEPILVGENGKFASERELFSYLEFCIAPYKDHPAFYGVQLFDEPKFGYLDSCAAVYSGLKKIMPEIAVQENLLNLCAPALIALEPSDIYTDYENYLKYYLERSGSDYLMTDEYAFRRNNAVSPYTVPTYQILAKTCRENNVELRLVMQSFSQEGNVIKDGEMDGGISWRRITEKDMYWQMHLALGFGCKEFSFFTYFTKTHKNFIGKRAVSDGIDGAAMVNLDGTRTKLYYATKKIIKEIKNFEPVIINYDFYKDYYFFENGKTHKDFEHLAMLKYINDGCPIDVKISAGALCVCELRDSRGNEMFMLENVTNPIEQLLYKKKPSVVHVDLQGLCGEFRFYKNGKRIERGVVFTEKMHCGDAIFIERII